MFWYYLVWPYTGEDIGLYKCPMDTTYTWGNPCGNFDASVKTFMNNFRSRTGEYFRTTYGLNARGLGGCTGVGPIVTIKRPADLLFVTDWQHGFGRYHNKQPEGCGAGWHEVHSKGLNVTYADGHGGWLNSRVAIAADKSKFDGRLPWANKTTY